MILEKGNEILQALSAEDVVTDVSTFMSDSTYIQIFAEVLPEMNFSSLQPGQTIDDMAANIDQILDFIEESAPHLDIKLLNGDMIVQGDLTQIAMMLELIGELLLMVLGEGDEEEDGEGDE